MEKTAKLHGQQFIEQSYANFRGLVHLGAAGVPGERPILAREVGSLDKDESKSTQLARFIDRQQVRSELEGGGWREREGKGGK